MGMNIIERIISSHSKSGSVKPGDIVDVLIDARAARDFGGANVVKNLKENGLSVDDPSKSLFTFDCNPTGSDQKYAVNQHLCRLFSRENDIKVYDINSGIGTHILIDMGYVYPGSTAVSTDSHANILGAVGAFGQGMGDMDIASAWNKGKVWFKVPESVRIFIDGKIPEDITAKDIVLNLLKEFGANSLLGYSIEMYGSAISELGLDERITISSMATEMGAIIILFPPNEEIISYCSSRTGSKFYPPYADDDAVYAQDFHLDASLFKQMVSLPGKPHDTATVDSVKDIRIDSAFIGSCTNGRISDMRAVAAVLKDRKVAPGVVLKIVPATDEIWNMCLKEGLMEIFKHSGALVSNAGCAGCAAGQVGQNGQGEITISTGNRNFPGKQGKGDVYLASPETVAASAIAGYITTPGRIPRSPAQFYKKSEEKREPVKRKRKEVLRPDQIEGRCWLILKDNIDTDMIFHNRYLAITNPEEMGQYTFDNLEGYEDFAARASEGDVIITGKNFGSGSSRQQAVDCFISLGIKAVIAESFGAIYERNAINAAFPVLTYSDISDLELKSGDNIRLNFVTGELTNLANNKLKMINPFYEVQLDIYKNGGLL